MRKYRNQPTIVRGIRFDSKAEAYRYLELLSMQERGEIEDLTLQPKFPLVVNGVKVADYIADFSYTVSGLVVVEDVKSKPTITRLYSLKKKLMWAIHGIKIKEVAA